MDKAINLAIGLMLKPEELHHLERYCLPMVAVLLIHTMAEAAELEAEGHAMDEAEMDHTAVVAEAVVLIMRLGAIIMAETAAPTVVAVVVVEDTPKVVVTAEMVEHMAEEVVAEAQAIAKVAAAMVGMAAARGYTAAQAAEVETKAITPHWVAPEQTPLEIILNMKAAEVMVMPRPLLQMVISMEAVVEEVMAETVAIVCITAAVAGEAMVEMAEMPNTAEAEAEAVMAQGAVTV